MNKYKMPTQKYYEVNNPVKGDLLQVLVNISNELAEANRLKLIDLRIKCQEFEFPQDENDPETMIRANELRDHAVNERPSTEGVKQ